MLQGYLEELRKTSLLEPEEELELWRRDAAGDEAAHQRLMTAYQPKAWWDCWKRRKVMIISVR